MPERCTNAAYCLPRNSSETKRLTVVAAVDVAFSDADYSDWKSESFHRSMIHHNMIRRSTLCHPEMKAERFSFRKLLDSDRFRRRDKKMIEDGKN
mgnify:CR=1 FL=1